MNDYKIDDFSIDTLRILDVKELKFTRRNSGYLYLEYKGDNYEEIIHNR